MHFILPKTEEVKRRSDFQDFRWVQRQKAISQELWHKMVKSVVLDERAGTISVIVNTLSD